MFRVLAVLIAVSVVVLLAADPGLACPNCSTAVANSESGEPGGTPVGFYYSILFMLGMPFLLLGGFGFAFYRLHKSAGTATVRKGDGEFEHPSRLIPPA